MTDNTDILAMIVYIIIFITLLSSAIIFFKINHKNYKLDNKFEQDKEHP